MENTTEKEIELVWRGKKDAIAEAQKPSTGAFNDVPEESVNPDTTRNLYIEADNIDALRFLREKGERFEIIYIDPPYNTGKDITYKNNFPHPFWCSMIFARLLIARQLLTDDGFIAIAIDDREMHRLRSIAGEVFGDKNFLGTIITRMSPGGRYHGNVNPEHEYHFLFAKDISQLVPLAFERKNENEMKSFLQLKHDRGQRPLRWYPLLEKDGKISTVTAEEFAKIYDHEEQRFNDDYMEELRKKYTAQGFRFILPFTDDGRAVIWKRLHGRTIDECKEFTIKNGKVLYPQPKKETPLSIWYGPTYSNTVYGTKRVADILDVKKSSAFDFPKSIYTVMDIISLHENKNARVLDFFGGSGTTAHAAWKQNIADGGNRRFVLAQIPAECDEEKTGFKNICEISKEYLRRAGAIEMRKSRVVGDGKLDAGFKVVRHVR